MFIFYGLRSLRERLVDLHSFTATAWEEIIDIANDSHRHLFSFQYGSYLLVILLLCIYMC